MTGMRQKMGMVFQQFNLFENMNVMKNLTIAPMKILKMPKDEAEAKAEELVRRVGLADKLTSFPSPAFGRTETAHSDCACVDDESRGDVI